MQEQLNTLVEKIKSSYAEWNKLSTFPSEDEKLVHYVREKMIAEFNDDIEVHAGKKYVKIVCKRSVWGFVVNVDNDKKFRKGDILKAATCSTPARNFARGNVFNEYDVYWTGA